jgi:GT2 family glycosyltransferase
MSMRIRKRAVILVLSSESEPWKSIEDKGIRTTWLLEAEQDSRVAVLFYYGDGSLGSGPELRGDRLYLPHPEGLENIGRKTVDAMAYVREHYDFDYLLRTNTSSYIDIQGYLRYLDNFDAGLPLYSGIPVQAGRGAYRTVFASGCGYTLSASAVGAVVDHPGRWDHELADDVAVAKIMKDAGIPLVGAPRYDVPSVEASGEFSHNSAATHFHVRCKMAVDRSGDITVMQAVHRVYRSLDRVEALPPIPCDRMPLFEVIICSWKRPEGVKGLLSDLDGQDIPEFPVTVWNNNPSNTAMLRGIRMRRGIDYSVVESPSNVGGRGRFLAARDTRASFVVFLDDDQRLTGPGALAGMLASARSATVGSWWAWHFEDRYDVRRRCTGGESARYCGTGGMVVDSAIFRDPLLWDTWPPEFHFVEDLWLSYVALHKGWTLQGHDYGIAFNDVLASDQHALFGDSGVRAKKQDLVDRYYPILASRSGLSSGGDDKELVNFLVRTSGRPRSFARALRSIASAGLSRYRVLVSVDTDETEEYVRAHGPGVHCVVRHEWSPKENRYHAPYNLYMNSLLEKVEDGWVVFLDDDNVLDSGGGLKRVLAVASRDTTRLYVGRCVNQASGRVIPSARSFGSSITMNDFDTLNMVVHSRVARRYLWCDRTGGDFRYAMSIVHGEGGASCVRWVDAVIGSMPEGAHHGQVSTEVLGGSPALNMLIRSTDPERLRSFLGSLACQDVTSPVNVLVCSKTVVAPGDAPVVPSNIVVSYCRDDLAAKAGRPSVYNDMLREAVPGIVVFLDDDLALSSEASSLSRLVEASAFTGGFIGVTKTIGPDGKPVGHPSWGKTVTRGSFSLAGMVLPVRTARSHLWSDTPYSGYQYFDSVVRVEGPGAVRWIDCAWASTRTQQSGAPASVRPPAASVLGHADAAGRGAPVVNFLIRTSGRPHSFARLLSSIEAQGFGGGSARVYVSADTAESLAYARVHGLVTEVVPVRRHARMDPSHAPYNLYMNHLLDKVTDGWVVFLDDDNVLEDGLRELLASTVLDPRKVYVTRCVNDRSGRLIPSGSSWGRRVVAGDIDTINLLVHASIAKKYQWDDMTGGDYRYAMALVRGEGLVNFEWVDVLVGRMPDGAHNGLAWDCAPAGS